MYPEQPFWPTLMVAGRALSARVLSARVLSVLVLAALVAACSGGGDGADDDAGRSPLGGAATVVVANSPGTLSTSGAQRVMTALIGDEPGAYLGGPDQSVRVRFTALDPEGETADTEAGVEPAEIEGEWLSTNASTLGLYVVPFTFDRAGSWEVAATVDGQVIGTSRIEVVERSSVPAVGDPALPSLTPTASTPEEIAAISTDPEPDPALYELTVADAVDNGRPTVVAFATPAFCQTALCGPTLEFVKAATAGRDDIDVVHVEPFDIEAARAGDLEPIPAMLDWGLQTEPWVFVVDADGKVASSFEGIIGQEELERAIDRL